MSTWQGVSHARMTRSMQSLPGGAYKVLSTVRRIIPDGARRKVSQAEIAKKAKVSEGTVSAALRQMDGIYLIRHFVGRGRGNGYEIEVLPPHEQRPAGSLSAPPKGSKSDPCNLPFESAALMPQNAPPEGSDFEPSTLLLHAHEQQQQTGPPPEAATPSEQAAQLAPETIAALADAGAHPKLIARVAASNPGCTAEQVAAAITAAQAKPNAHTPPGLALECLANRQQVIVPRARPEKLIGGKQSPIDPSALPPDLYRLGSDESDLGSPGDAEETEADLLDQAEAARREPEPAVAVATVIDLPGLMFAAYNLLGLVTMTPGRIQTEIAEPSPSDAAFLAAHFTAGDDARAAVAALRRHRADELLRLKAESEAQIAEVAALIGGAPPNPDERRIIARRLDDMDSPGEIAAAIRAKRERQPTRRGPTYRLLGGGS